MENEYIQIINTLICRKQDLEEILEGLDKAFNLGPPQFGGCSYEEIDRSEMPDEAVEFFEDEKDEEE